MVQNLGQTDNSYFTVGDTYTVVSQGFTTGSDGFGYRLQGIGVNIEGSDDSNGNAQVPSGPTSVSVAVHADSSGKPGAKLFDLVSPTEYAPGHSFFEAPLGTNLAAEHLLRAGLELQQGHLAQAAADLEQQRGLGRSKRRQHR